jgi:hypothetical protein
MHWHLHPFAVKSYDLEVPFQAAGHGGMGHVGRTDVGGGKPGIPPEMIEQTKGYKVMVKVG